MPTNFCRTYFCNKPRNRVVLGNKQNNSVPSLMIAIVLPDLDE